MNLRNALYRLWQFGVSLRSLLLPPDDTPARRVLSLRGYALFRRMRPYDRAHALRVLRYLEERGEQEEAILQAALLHDVAKSAGEEVVPLLYRGAAVLARRIPPLWRRLVRERPAGHPLRPFYLYATHAHRSAALSREAGCTEAVAALITAHEEGGPHAEGRLREADRNC